MSRLDIDGLAQSLFLMLGDYERPAGLYTGVSPEEHTTDIIDLETKLHLALSRTRVMKNGLSAINRLPQEVLAHIFLMLQIEPLAFPFFKADFYGWLRVVQVCHHWRITAFSHPHLWSQIHLRSPSDPVALMSINRSGQIPLRVYNTMNHRCKLPPRQPGITSSALKTVGEHAHRLKELHISGPWTLNTGLWTYLHSPAPNLEILTIMPGSKLANNLQPLPLLFSDCTPRLRELTLGYVSNWSANRFRDLTHLSLFDQREETQIPLHQFLDFLRDSPSLEKARFIRASPHPAQLMLSEEVLAPVSLTQLNYIEVGDWTDTENIVRFLSHLEVPRLATRCIWGHSLEEFSPLVNSFADNPLNHINRVVLMGHHNDRQMLGIKDGTLYIHGPVRPSQYESLFASATIPAAIELILGSPAASVPSTAQLCCIMRAMPTIETLTVTGAARFEVHRLLEALGLFNTNDPVGSSGEVIAPNLHTLKIFLYKPSDRESVLLNVLPLSLLAEARAARGYPIDHLVIERVHGAFLESLEAYFETVNEVCRASRYADEYFEEELLDDIWRKIDFGEDRDDDVDGWN